MWEVGNGMNNMNNAKKINNIENAKKTEEKQLTLFVEKPIERKTEIEKNEYLYLIKGRPFTIKI